LDSLINPASARGGGKMTVNVVLRNAFLLPAKRLAFTLGVVGQTAEKEVAVAQGEWSYVCEEHGRATKLRCYRCKRPICIKCAYRTAGVGYICQGCKQELLARFDRLRK
jgi:hypothetical protein